MPFAELLCQGEGPDGSGRERGNAIASWTMTTSSARGRAEGGIRNGGRGSGTTARKGKAKTSANAINPASDVRREGTRKQHCVS